MCVYRVLYYQCEEHGECDGMGACICDPGWKGEACQTMHCPDDCNGDEHGQCDDHKCVCEVIITWLECILRSNIAPECDHMSCVRRDDIFWFTTGYTWFKCRCVNSCWICVLQYRSSGSEKPASWSGVRTTVCCTEKREVFAPAENVCASTGSGATTVAATVSGTTSN